MQVNHLPIGQPRHFVATLTEAVTRLRAHDGELGMWEMRHRH